MRPSIAFLLAFLTAFVNAHFRTQFPPPRGPFNATAQVNFCDGYTTPAPNRTPFPLKGGFVTLNFSHGISWTAGLYISTSQNPTKFEDFAVHNYVGWGQKPGNYCLPLDLSESNVKGLSDGQNITLQIQWAADEGGLYQCADLTLSSSLNLSSTQKCENSTSTTTTHSAATRIVTNSIVTLGALVVLSGLLLL